MLVQSATRFVATKVTFQDTIELGTREKGNTNVLLVNQVFKKVGV